MSTRGGRPPGAVPRPTTPPDPTLLTRPVPDHRNFVPVSFGQGALSDLPFRSLQELDSLPGADPALSNELVYSRERDPVRRLIEELCEHEKIYNGKGISYSNSTWGFRVFVTAYSSLALERMPQAIENLVKVTERGIGGGPPAYTSEAIRRFKLDVIKDEEALSGASNDRVREEFRSLLRTLHPGEYMIGEDDDDPWPYLGQNLACLFLDEDTISMLASLEFGEGGHLEDYSAFKGKNIKVVDSSWIRQPTEWPGQDPNARPYRGVDQCPIVSLDSLYFKLTLSSWGGQMEENFPYYKQCYYEERLS